MKNTMKDEMLSHLRGNIAPFWLGLIDREYGGFYGLLTYNLKLDKKAVKGCILNSRILWFFSNLILLERKTGGRSGSSTEIEKACLQAYDFLKKAFLDRKTAVFTGRSSMTESLPMIRNTPTIRHLPYMRFHHILMHRKIRKHYAWRMNLEVSWR